MIESLVDPPDQTTWKWKKKFFVFVKIVAVQFVVILSKQFCRFLYRGLCFSWVLFLLFVLDLRLRWEKAEKCGGGVSESDGLQHCYSWQRNNFSVNWKSNTDPFYVVSVANNNVRSAAMDICSSVTRCFTLLKLDTHSKVLKLRARRGVTRENYRFVRFTSFTSTPLFSPSIFCSYITAIT